MEVKMQDIQFTISKKICNDLINNNEYLLHNLALIILKPECLAMNKVNYAIQVLHEFGFEPIYIKIKKLSQNQAMSLWQYGWKNANTERIILNFQAATWKESAILILRDTNKLHEDSCMFLNNFKGSSINSSSNSHTIRGRLGTINNYINFVHCSDNYDEFVRELFILLDITDFIELIDIVKLNKVCTYELIRDIFDPYINELKVGDLLLQFKTYINYLISKTNNMSDNLLHQKLVKAYKDRIISTDLFVELLTKHQIMWTWEELLIFTQFTRFDN